MGKKKLYNAYLLCPEMTLHFQRTIVESFTCFPQGELRLSAMSAYAALRLVIRAYAVSTFQLQSVRSLIAFSKQRFDFSLVASYYILANKTGCFFLFCIQSIGCSKRQNMMSREIVCVAPSQGMN